MTQSFLKEHQYQRTFQKVLNNFKIMTKVTQVGWCVWCGGGSKGFLCSQNPYFAQRQAPYLVVCACSTQGNTNHSRDEPFPYCAGSLANWLSCVHLIWVQHSFRVVLHQSFLFNFLATFFRVLNGIFLLPSQSMSLENLRTFIWYLSLTFPELPQAE